MVKGQSHHRSHVTSESAEQICDGGQKRVDEWSWIVDETFSKAISDYVVLFATPYDTNRQIMPLASVGHILQV